MTADSDDTAASDAGGRTSGSDEAARLETHVPGIEVTTQLPEGDVEALEAVHRRQLEWALEHADEAKESTRL